MCNKRTARDLQQFLGSLYGSKDCIPWDLFLDTERAFLQDKIKLLVPDVERDFENAQNINKKLEKTRESLVNQIWTQRKYYGGQLLMSILYVLCVNKDKIVGSAKDQIQYSIYPVFRIRKCYRSEDSSDCCMIFVDDSSRVYKHWDDYKNNNILPESIIVAPKNGVYNFDDDDNVILECFPSPSSEFSHKAGNVMGVTAGCLGFGAAAITLGALVLPIAAPVLAGAAIVGFGSSAVVTGSSILRMVDRGNHDESLDPTKDSQARSDWIGVASGVFGLGAGGATAAMAKYASTGRNVTAIVKGTVNGLNGATIAINGVGLGNEISEIVLKKLDGDDVSVLDVAQLGVSLFLVTHSVYNFKTASKIVTSSRDKSIKNFRRSLSKHQRKAFQKAVQETIRVRGVYQGKMDVIRALNNVPESKQLLNDLYKVNRKLNNHDIRASLHPGGDILLNNNVKVDSATLRNNFQQQNGKNFVGQVGSVPSSHNTISGKNYLSWNYNPLSSSKSEILAHVLRIIGKAKALDKAIDKANSAISSSAISSFAIFSSTKLADCVRNIAVYVAEEVLDKLCCIVKDFIFKYGREIAAKLSRVIPFEQVLWDAFQVAVVMCGGKKKVSEFIRTIEGRYIMIELKAFYEKMQPKLGERVKCKICRGSYYIAE